MNPQSQNTTVFLVGRLVVGGLYTWAGIQNLLKLDAQAGYAAFKGVPFAPIAVACASLLILAGGLSILSGIRPRLGIAAVVLFLLPVTLMMHNFWTMEGMQRVSEMYHFQGNILLIGSALLLVAVPQPWPVSLDSWFLALFKHTFRYARYAVSALSAVAFGMVTN
jgi:putative oxidoreductase